MLFLVPYLLLPVSISINLPGVPSLNKGSIPALIAFIILYSKYKNFKLLPSSGLCRLLVITLFIFPFMTLLTNQDAVRYASKVLPALTFKDLPNMLFSNIVQYYIPFMAGYSYLKSKEAHKNTLIVIVLAGFVYALPTLWEIRMSPQLHKDIYGFFPHDWRQQIRQGGFRPVVFLGHGLLVAVFFSQVLIAASVLWKNKTAPLHKRGFIAVLFFVAILILSKSWSALIYGILSLTLLIFFNTKKWLQVAVTISLLVGLFPFLRSMDLVPTTATTNFLAQYNPARAASLQFRFDNEDLLLAKANERPLFGWGGWGRSRAFDPLTGQDVSVTDGAWILIFGPYGWLGYLATFGILVLPIVNSLWPKGANKGYEIDKYGAGLCLMLAFNLLDLIPNSSLTPLTFLIGGAILGRLHYYKQERSETDSNTVQGEIKKVAK